MPVAAIGPAIGAASSLLGGVLGSGAAGDASSLLRSVLSANSGNLTNASRNIYYNQELPRLNPYMQGGMQADRTLASLLKTPGQGLLQGYGSFQAPTGVNFQNDPGYQFRLQQGVDALQNSAAARGDLLSGNTLKALTDYGQNFGSNEYQNVYNRALQTYGTNQSNFYENQANTFNRLTGMGGMGLNASQLANQASQNYLGNYGNALGMSNQAAGAGAAGIMGSNNAWQNALGGIGGFGMNLASLLGQGGNQMSPGILNASAIAQPPSTGAFSNSPFYGAVPGAYSPTPQLWNQSGYQVPSFGGGQ